MGLLLPQLALHHTNCRCQQLSSGYLQPHRAVLNIADLENSEVAAAMLASNRVAAV